MANKTNLEILHNTIETSTAVYHLEKLSKRFNGNRWSITTEYKTPIESAEVYGGKLSKAVNFYPNKAAALAALDVIVPAATMAVVRGVCLNHTAKMAGMISFSTLCLKKQHCLERMNNGALVCSHCFAAVQLKRQKENRDKLERNTDFITSTVYSHSYFPVFRDYKKIRLESFGDLNNETQAENYIRFAEVNKHAAVALWTKNPWILWNALEKRSFKKPANMIVIFSSPAVNKPAANVPNLYIMPNGKSMIDKVFTVYDGKVTDTVNINCGARSCITCGRCYTKKTGRMVNEKLK